MFDMLGNQGWVETSEVCMNELEFWVGYWFKIEDGRNVKNHDFRFSETMIVKVSQKNRGGIFFLYTSYTRIIDNEFPFDNCKILSSLLQ